MMFIFNLVVISLAASVCVKAEAVSESLNVPPYTTHVENIVHANILLKHDVKLNNNSAEFLKIYTSVIDLADQVAKKGKNAFPDFYFDTVLNALEQVLDNPVAANDKLMNPIHKTNMALQKLVSFVLYKQFTECVLLPSHECDVIIASQLMYDSALKQSAKLLVAAGKHGKIFIEVSHLFKAASKDYDAEKFLIAYPDVMKPLVLAAHETKKALESLKH